MYRSLLIVGPNLIPYLKASYSYSPLFVIFIIYLMIYLCNLDDFRLLLYITTDFSIDEDLFNVPSYFLRMMFFICFKNESYLFQN